MTGPTDTNQASEDEPINQHLVCLWQLQDIEETIADAAPEELVELHSKLVALSTDITEAVQSAIRTEKLKLLDALEAKAQEYVVIGEQLRGLPYFITVDNIKAERNKLEAEL